MSSPERPAQTPPPAPPADDLGFDLPQPAAMTRTRGLAIGVGLAAPRVVVVSPQPVSSDRALVLPGSIQPLEETVVYPRVSGYVRKWSVDIGDKVEEGQILAEIDTPELDQELAQARAQLVQANAGLVQAQANRDLSRSSVQRYEQLVPAGVAPQEELEQRQGQAHVAEASVTVARAAITAQQANIQRILDLKKFAKIAAPFAGTVTSRTIDRGALVTAGNGTPLFRIAATDPVRVFVGVPQDVAPSVRVDAPAKVTVREFAGQPFQGTIARTAGALDAATRTMNTEVRVPNPDGRLLAGMYAEVALTLPTPHRVLEIPATALYNDAKGLRVAVVDPGSKIRFAPITVERDTGATIHVSTGLDGSERIVKLASAELTDGMAVEVLK